MTKPKRIGRPPRTGSAAVQRVVVRLSDEERRRWQASADRARVSLAEWIRGLGNEAAEIRISSQRPTASRVEET